MASQSMDNQNEHSYQDPKLRLKHLRVQNMRKILDLDLEIPESTRVICLVGPNGSGKSTLLVELVDALAKMTWEEIPGLVEGDSQIAVNSIIKTVSTTEISPQTPALAMRQDWKFTGGSSSYWKWVRTSDIEAGKDIFKDNFGVTRPDIEKQWYINEWKRRPTEQYDPLAGSVFMYRPSNRFEIPSYKKDVPNINKIPLSMHKTIDRMRALPVQVITSLDETEQIMMDLYFDHMQGHIPGATRLTEMILKEITDWFSEFPSHKSEYRPNFALSTWPSRRLFFGPIESLAQLSSGELDYLVTIVQIIAQQAYISAKFGGGIEEAHLPSGWVFIDEVDMHLHPQWQMKIMPRLLELFPTINFVITTHSPFVLRSLKPENSLVVRLPDGHVFHDDFSSCTIEEILQDLFEAQSGWNEDVEKNVQNLEKKLKADKPETYKEAANLYKYLYSKSDSLRNETDQILVLFGSAEFHDYLSQRGEDIHAPS